MGLYEVPLSVFLLGFGGYVSHFHMGDIMLLLRAVLNMLVRNASPRGPMCFRLLVYCLLDVRSGECNALSLYFMCCSVNGSVCHVCCVSGSVCELFDETNHNIFGCGCYFVMEVLSVGGCALLDRPCMVFQRMSVLCL